jgi:ribosomal protein S18 acetylase RimI-like enzyme
MKSGKNSTKSEGVPYQKQNLYNPLIINLILGKMSTIVLKKAALSDLDALQQIGRQTFSETFSEHNSEENMAHYLQVGFSKEKLSAELSNPETEFYFATHEDQIIGYLKINTGEAQTELKGNNTLEIERIYVLAAFQGKKVGQLLYEKAMEIARQKKVDYVWLGVWEKNLKAIRFYQKNGFVVFDKHLFKLGDEVQTDLMMKIRIE